MSDKPPSPAVTETAAVPRDLIERLLSYTDFETRQRDLELLRAALSQQAQPAEVVAWKDAQEVYDGMTRRDPMWNAYGRSREGAVALALTVVQDLLAASPPPPPQPVPAIPDQRAEPPEESPAEEALRDLASWLGCGGYNAPTVDAKVFKEKIIYGVEHFAAQHQDAAERLAEAVLDLDMATARGIRVKDLARALLKTKPGAATHPSREAREPLTEGWIQRTISRMFRDENTDPNQWGHYHAKGWNAALMQLMDYLAAQPVARPLTDARIGELWDAHVRPVFGKNGINPHVFARAIEKAHGIGATPPAAPGAAK